MTLPRSPNTGQAVEYLRRSVERDKSADKDKGAGQRRANAEQAARDGVSIARTFDGDWGISGGRGKRERRHAMAELIEAIRAGTVSRCYCHTTDRLARDVEYGMALWNACKDTGTILRPGSQTFDPSEPGYLTLWTVLLAQAEEDLDRMTRKNQDQQDYGRDHASTCPLPGRPHLGRCHLIGCTDTTHCSLSHERGQKNYGEMPGEDVAAVLAALDEAGSYNGAASLLNERQVPTRRAGSAGWSVRSVARVARRERPETPHAPSECPLRPVERGPARKAWKAADCPHPHAARMGARARGPHVLSGLVRCGGTYPDGRTCGAIMSTMPRPDGRSPALYCVEGKSHKTTHSRPIVVSSAKLLDLRDPLNPRGPIEEEARHYRAKGTDLDAPDTSAQLADLEDERGRLLHQHAKRYLTDAELDRDLAPVLASIDALTREAAGVPIPQAISWTAPVPELNAWLRAIWPGGIELGADLLPVSFGWVPGWRAD
jgi:hypothetical protein